MHLPAFFGKIINGKWDGRGSAARKNGTCGRGARCPDWALAMGPYARLWMNMWKDIMDAVKMYAWAIYDALRE